MCVCVCRGEGVTEWGEMRDDSGREEVRGKGMWVRPGHTNTRHSPPPSLRSR